MVKKLLVMVVAIAVVLFSLGSAFAQDVRLGDKVNLGVNCSAVMPVEDGAGTGIYVGGLLSYDILKYLAIGIESGYGQIDEKASGITFGTFRVVPLLGDIIVKAPIEMDKFTLTPYGIVGAGILFSDYSSQFPGWSVETDPAFAMKFGGGVKLTITKNIALNFEASYLMADIDATANLGDQTIAGTSKADSWLIGGGITVRF